MDFVPPKPSEIPRGKKKEKEKRFSALKNKRCQFFPYFPQTVSFWYPAQRQTVS